MDVSTGGGTVRVDLTEPSSFPYVQEIENGTMVALEAVPSFGYVFDGWKGDLISDENPEFLRVDCAKTVYASFSVDWRFIGTFIGCAVLVLFFVTILVIRQRHPVSTTPETDEDVPAENS